VVEAGTAAGDARTPAAASGISVRNRGGASVDSDWLAMRAQLELPQSIHLPPDFTVPLVVPPDVVAEWVAQDAAGSADAPCALGQFHFQRRQLDEAGRYFRSGAERGSATAAYGRCLVAAFLGADDGEVRRLLSCADEAGSAMAAADLASLHEAEGAVVAAEAAAVRARHRAHAGDEGESADAALLLSTLLDDPQQRGAALLRAYERGSSVAAVYVGGEAERVGDLNRAVDAYLLAVRRGQIRAGLQMGLVLAQSGRRRAARRAWSQTRRLAIAAGDEKLFTAAHAELVPPLRTVLKRHRLMVFVAACVMATLLVIGGWRWSVTLALSMGCLLLPRTWPVKDALFTPAHSAPAGVHAFRARGVSFTVLLTEGVPIEGRPVHRQVAGTSDIAHAMVISTACVGVLVAVAFWAAGRVTFTQLLAYVALASAADLAFVTLRSFSRTWRPPAEPAAGVAVENRDHDRRDTVDVTMAIGLLPFTKSSFRFGVTDPRIPELVAATHAARPEVQPLWSRRVEAFLGATLGLTGATMLALPAVAPAYAPSFRTTIDTVETVAVVWVLVVCALRVTHAVRYRREDWAVAAGLYAALATVMATLASFLGVWDPIGVILGSR
jgi:hypothetical protein